MCKQIDNTSVLVHTVQCEVQFVISQDFDQFENEIRKLAGRGQGGGRKPNSQGERSLWTPESAFSHVVLSRLCQMTLFSQTGWF